MTEAAPCISDFIVAHAGSGLERDAAGIEGDAFADEHNRRHRPLRPPVLHDDEHGRARTPAIDPEEPTHAQPFNLRLREHAYAETGFLSGCARTLGECFGIDLVGRSIGKVARQEYPFAQGAHEVHHRLPAPLLFGALYGNRYAADQTVVLRRLCDVLIEAVLAQDRSLQHRREPFLRLQHRRSRHRNEEMAQLHPPCSLRSDCGSSAECLQLQLLSRAHPHQQHSWCCNRPVRVCQDDLLRRSGKIPAVECGDGCRDLSLEPLPKLGELLLTGKENDGIGSNPLPALALKL
jgi:hypothetical protein